MGHRFQGLSMGRIAKRGAMNKTEARYARMLDEMIRVGQLTRYWFEPLSLRLSSPPQGQPARYSPDFVLLYPDGRTVIVDVKGGMVNEASIVRIKCAAEQFPLWEFWIVTWSKGKWSTQEV